MFERNIPQLIVKYLHTYKDIFLSNLFLSLNFILSIVSQISLLINIAQTSLVPFRIVYNRNSCFHRPPKIFPRSFSHVYGTRNTGHDSFVALSWPMWKASYDYDRAPHSRASTTRVDERPWWKMVQESSAPVVLAYAPPPPPLISRIRILYSIKYVCARILRSAQLLLPFPTPYSSLLFPVDGARGSLK